MGNKVLAAAMLLALPLISHAQDRKDAELAMTEAGASIDAAERADAAQFASTDLATAHNMLANAQGAYDHHHWTDSVFNAENAKADANLASARSREQRAEQATAEVERSVATLREQMGISDGGQP